MNAAASRIVRIVVFFTGNPSEEQVAFSRLTQDSNTSSSVSRCCALAFGSRFCENGGVTTTRGRDQEKFMNAASAANTTPGNFFEDFRLGQQIRHATPRTITTGDVALYNGLFGPRFAVQSSDVFARKIGYPRAPVDDLLVFHIVFGKSVPDVSLNAVANLGYAAFRVLAPVYPGDTLNAVSEVIGLKENSSRKTGIVFVRTTGCRQDGGKVLEYVR